MDRERVEIFRLSSGLRLSILQWFIAVLSTEDNVLIQRLSEGLGKDKIQQTTKIICFMYTCILINII